MQGVKLRHKNGTCLAACPHSVRFLNPTQPKRDRYRLPRPRTAPDADAVKVGVKSGLKYAAEASVAHARIKGIQRHKGRALGKHGHAVDLA